MERRGSDCGGYLRGRKGWLKSVQIVCLLLFIWRLFMNKLATKDNLCRRRVLDISQVSCSAL